MSDMHEITSGSADETRRLGAELAGRVRPGDVIWLTGELGAGKTVFAAGLLEQLGAEGPFSSPTFTIARRYDDASPPVSHLDLYRLGPGLAGEDPGLLESEYGVDRLTIVEWPDRGEGVLPAPAWRVHLAHAEGGRRDLRISRCE